MFHMSVFKCPYDSPLTDCTDDRDYTNSIKRWLFDCMGRADLRIPSILELVCFHLAGASFQS